MKTFISIKPKYKPKNKYELSKLVEDLSIKLWEIDTSLIEDMSNLFYRSIRVKNVHFEGIQYWDVSNVKTMDGMFSERYYFNQPLNDWDVSNVKYMRGTFFNCRNFNQPLDKWDVSNVCIMDKMFKKCHSFNQPLDNWNVSNVESMQMMFESADSFDQDLSNWDFDNIEYSDNWSTNAITYITKKLNDYLIKNKLNDRYGIIFSQSARYYILMDKTQKYYTELRWMHILRSNYETYMDSSIKSLEMDKNEDNTKTNIFSLFKEKLNNFFKKLFRK